MNNYIEKLVCQWLIKRIRKGYGTNCITYDKDDFPPVGTGKFPRCPSCEARDTVKWLEKHIELLED